MLSGCSGGPEQQWQVMSSGEVHNKASGTCLDAALGIYVWFSLLWRLALSIPSVYFDFVESYIKALQPVALGGLALWLLEARWPDSRPAVVANTVYRAVISVWSLVVVRQLDRRQQRQMKRSTSKKWSSLKLRVSKTPPEVPTRRRVWLFLRSVGVTAGMLAVAFGAVVSCLNLQGLMNPDHTGAL